MSKKEFIRSVITLATGTTIAQAIPVLFTPIITRLYTPQDFGVFALYNSTASIIAILATGRYDQAIMLPSKDSLAANLLSLCAVISLFVSVATLVLVFFFNSFITNLLGNQIVSMWLYYLPISVFLLGLYQALNYWSIRKKQYKLLSIVYIIQTSIASCLSLALAGMGIGGGGLILSNIVGQILSVFLLAIMIWRKDKYVLLKTSKFKQIIMAKRYADFPKIMLLSGFIEVFSSNLPSVIISNIFGARNVGYYNLLQIVIKLPGRVLGQSIGNVFRQQATEDLYLTGSCRTLFVSTLKKLVFLSTPIFVIFYIISPYVFPAVFGQQWFVVGEFAQILTPMFYFQFIVSPLSAMFFVAEKQKYDLYLQIILLSFIGISFLVGFVTKDFKTFLHALTISYCMKYIYELIKSYDFTLRENI